MISPPSIDPASLPLWMQRTLRGRDWGGLLAALFALVAAFPFALQPGTPIGTDFERAAFRATDLAESIREGALYPRWTDEAFGGYGAPIPQFTPPLPGLIAAVIDLTVIEDMPATLTLLLVALMVAGALAVYAWITTRCGSGAGLTAAVLFCFTPYVGHQIPHLYGDPKVILTAALIPALWWSVDRARLIGHDRPSLLVALLCAALLLTDPRAAGIAVGLAIAFTIAAPIAPRRSLRGLLSALVCGIALAGTYWFPALIEGQAIFWLPADIQPTISLTLTSLFRLPNAIDPLALLTPIAPSLGLAAVVSAAIGLLVRIIRRTTLPAFFIVGIGASAGLLTALLISSEPGLLPLLAVLLAGMGTLPLVGRDRWTPSLGRLLPIGMCALAIGAALPLWLSGRGGLLTDEKRTFNSAAQIAFEQSGFGAPTLAVGAMSPTTMRFTPPRDPALVRGYLAGEPDKALVTSGSAQIGSIETTAHLLRLQFTTFSQTTIALLYADFPGWEAAIGGEPVPLIREPDQPGLALLLAEDLRGELTLRFGTTPARLGGWALSAIGAAACFALLLRRRVPDEDAPLHRLTTAEARLFTVLLAGLVGVVVLNAASPEWAALAGWTPEAGVGLAAARPLDIRSDVGLELIAYAPYAARAAPGDDLDLALYWQILRPVEQNYRTQIGLRDRVTGQIDTLSLIRHPGDLPLPRWQPRRYVRDSWSIAVPPSLTSGEYDIVVSAFVCDLSCDARQSITFFDPSGAAIGTVITLPTPLTITPP